MSVAANVVERRIPDHTSTEGLTPRLAADVDFYACRRSPSAESGRCDRGVQARALVIAGEPAAARRVLEALDVDSLRLHGRAAAAWAAARVGPDATIRALAESFGSGPDMIDDDGVPLGPRERYSGALLAAAGDVVGGAGALRRAVTVGDARAPLWGALARVEFARVLTTAAAVGHDDVAFDPDEARRTSVAARTFFAAGGYRGLLARFDVELGSPARPGEASTGLLVDGDTWLGGFGVQPAGPIPDGKGLRAIRHLLMHRHRVVASVELARVVDDGDVAEIAEMFADLDLLSLVDARAARLASTEVVRLRSALLDDTARSRIGKLIRRTVARVGVDQPLLASHLGAAIGTGHVCRYSPLTPVDWELGATD